MITKSALKYCGSCNPQVELGHIASRIRALAHDFMTFVPLTGGGADLVIILNGCLTACADRQDVRSQARDAIVVAGESVETQSVPEAKLADAIVEAIKIRLATATTGIESS
ncbi:MAG: hypothetical protein M1482_09600 [Chloroflexi bacterium]|nr:hypothetical protein [Chloroflexota bacterium]